jgi:hypothetical protein
VRGVGHSNIQAERTEAYDTWRQIIYPALVSGKPWSTSSSAAWSTEDKIELVVKVRCPVITGYTG